MLQVQFDPKKILQTPCIPDQCRYPSLLITGASLYPLRVFLHHPPTHPLLLMWTRKTQRHQRSLKPAGNEKRIFRGYQNGKILK
jgi:hypothetical protein